MALAQYEILIPQTGAAVANATATYLSSQLKTAVHVEASRNVYIDGQNASFDVVITQAEDSPITDSHVKQTASFAADVAKVPVITVSKNGKEGISTWPIRNTNLPTTPQGI